LMEIYINYSLKKASQQGHDKDDLIRLHLLSITFGHMLPKVL